ncbi:glycoside hydrolase family 172 protein [Planctomycetota bacterium]
MSDRPLYSPVCLFILVTLSLSIYSVEKSAADEWAPGIQELYRLDRLAVFKESLEVASVSSYDRTGGNNDGFGGQYSFVRKEKDGLVLADLQGPGVIYRIWTPTPTDDMLEFYFDGENEPSIRVKFRDLFLGKHPIFVRPLVGYGAGGFYSYVPLTYEKSCKVFIRAERLQFYQINYARYPKGTPIASFPKQQADEYNSHLEKAIELFGSYGADVSSYAVPPGGSIERFITNVRLKPSETKKIFEINHPGRIVGIHISPSGALVDKDRGIILRAYWDSDEEPAILCPAGDFVGYAWDEPATKSLLIGTANGKNYCYFPMPFDKSARIELISEGNSDKEIELQAEVLFVPIGRRENEGKFYAIWRRENPTTKGKPFTFIETEGRGHLVGFIQQSQGFKSGNTYFFEGDDQTTIDGKLVIHGTGSEDFYNGGWYDVTGRWDSKRSFPLSGCLTYKKHLGRTGGYRFLLGDAYSYRKSILQTIEHAPTDNDLLNDYCAVTFLYSRDRPTCEFTLSAPVERKVVDLKRIVFATWWNIPIDSFSYRTTTLKKNSEKLEGKDVRFLSLRAEGTDTFGHHFISFICELPVTGRYRVSIDVVKGPSQGKIQIFVDEAPVGPQVDLYATERKIVEDEYVSTLDLIEGPNRLLFKLVGKHPESQGLGLDLTNIICERMD